MTTRRSIAQYAKEAEREVARRIGGKRLPSGTHQSAGDIDVDGGWWAAQVKHRPWPEQLRKGLRQAQAGAKDMQVPLVAWLDKPGGGKEARLLVCMDAADWVDMNGMGTPAEEA